jgi:hypothetical protein
MNEIAELYADADKPKSGTKEYYQEYYKKNRDKILLHSGLYYHTILKLKTKHTKEEYEMRNIPLTPQQEYNKEYYQKNKQKIQETNKRNYQLRKQKQNQK